MTNEVCQRCKEPGNDRRTLPMECFYDMSELGIPFEIVQNDGAYYCLRVCKNCQSDWMKAIEDWFHTGPKAE